MCEKSEKQKLAEEAVREAIAQMEVEKAPELREKTCPFSEDIHSTRMLLKQIKDLRKMLWTVVIMLCGTLISISFHNPSLYTFIKDLLFNG